MASSSNEKSNKFRAGWASRAVNKSNVMSVMDTKGDEGLLAVIAAAREKRKEEQKRIAFRKRCKRIGKFVLTLSVLMLMNVLLLVGGGFLFEHLEGTNEIENCKEQRGEYLDALNSVQELVVAKAAIIRGDDGITSHTTDLLATSYRELVNNFGAQVHKIGYNKYHNCTHLGSNATWTFSNGLVFSLTVITTIGYGAISPKTPSGQILCIIYAVIGIPVYIVTLASIGDILAKLFKKVYWIACCCGCCNKHQAPDTSCEEEDFKISAMKNRMSDPRWDDGGSDNEDGDGSGEECYKEEDVTIPLIITISVLFGSIVLGGVIFVYWEKHWDFLDAVYFSFVTVSTIGFGDLVPHLDLEDGRGIGKISVVIIYITIGMSTVSMCFQLMADEIVAKFNWISSKCGLAKKSSDDDDETGNLSEDTPKTPTRKFSMRSNRMGQGFSRANSLRRSGTRIDLTKNRSPITPRKYTGSLALPVTPRRTTNLVMESKI